MDYQYLKNFKYYENVNLCLTGCILVNDGNVFYVAKYTYLFLDRGQWLIAPERIKQLGQSTTVYKIGNQQGPIM